MFRVANWRELGAAEFPYDTTRYYRLRVENEGPRIRAFIDGKLILTADDGELIRGKAGVTANIPARFQDFRVTASDEVKARIDERIARREAELAGLRSRNPRPKLWKQFATPKFGAGRNVRFGDLDGDGAPEMLIAQNIPRIGDNFIQISCLTAVTLDGKVLWQLGRPDPRNGLLTADTPVPDPRHRRRRPQRGRDGQGLQAPGARGRHGPGPEVGLDAAGSSRQWEEALRADQRRRAGVPQPLRAARAPRAPGQGPLLELLGLRQPPRAAVAGPGADRPLPVSRSTSTATAATSSRSVTRSGTTEGDSSGATTRSCRTTPTASRSATSATTPRPSRGSTPGAATRGS